MKQNILTSQNQELNTKLKPIFYKIIELIITLLFLATWWLGVRLFFNNPIYSNIIQYVWVWISLLCIITTIMQLSSNNKIYSRLSVLSFFWILIVFGYATITMF